MGLGKIATLAPLAPDTGDDTVTKYIVRRWDKIYPWMRFFARNCLPPPYDVLVAPPRPDLCNVFDAAKICISPLTIICTRSEEGRHLLRSSVSVQHFIAQLWIFVGNIRGDILPGDPGTTSDGFIPMLRTTFALTNYVCVSKSEDPDKITLPLSNYIHAAGGVKPVVITLLKYIRRITRDAAAVKEPQSWTTCDESVQQIHSYLLVSIIPSCFSRLSAARTLHAAHNLSDKVRFAWWWTRLLRSHQGCWCKQTRNWILIQVWDSRRDRTFYGRAARTLHLLFAMQMTE
ncbi:hypothetical protein BDR05DRAFT_489038 [Suillus weaverae]|nr:hypothetical protein BDR05DRAFT_489038 [Suillus weaverae]